ncbi:hypothetical protein FGB62_346g01 [Gracilaria domingensis]|nr:hypothetical protein FGB62_346g01 [Gracilaria domingensis]
MSSDFLNPHVSKTRHPDLPVTSLQRLEKNRIPTAIGFEDRSSNPRKDHSHRDANPRDSQASVGAETVVVSRSAITLCESLRQGEHVNGATHRQTRCMGGSNAAHGASPARKRKIPVSRVNCDQEYISAQEEANGH